MIALKGACFALTIYPDIGLRPMSDLDVLVPASRLDEAVEIAKQIGYQESHPEAVIGQTELLSNHVLLQKSGQSQTVIEIHHSLVAGKNFAYAVPVEWFLGQAQPLSVQSDGKYRNLLVLSPPAQVLFAASHAMLQHGGKDSPLRWYYDLDQIIRFYSPQLDWNLLLKQAKMFKWGTALSAAISQTCIYFSTPVPEHVLDVLSRMDDENRQWVEARKHRPSTHILDEVQNLQALNWAGRFVILFGLVVPSPAYMRWRYSFKTNWLLPYYYLIRWWGIVKDAGRTLLALFKHSSLL